MTSGAKLKVVNLTLSDIVECRLLNEFCLVSLFLGHYVTPPKFLYFAHVMYSELVFSMTQALLNSSFILHNPKNYKSTIQLMHNFGIRLKNYCKNPNSSKNTSILYQIR